MTRSAAAAVLWDIWRRHRAIFAVVTAMTVVGRVLELQSAQGDSSVLVELLRMLSFLLLFGIFSYTESSDSRGLGRFPQRLFVLPVSSLQLVAVPVLAGVVSVELLYLVWLDPVSMGGFTSATFNAAVVGALMVCSQAAIWTLDRLGPFRLVVVGVLVVIVFWVTLLPSQAPAPPPVWRSEGGLATVILGVAFTVFVGTWRHINRLRSGGWRGVLTIDALGPAWLTMVPRRRRAFRSPAAAQFWFEWRCSGLMLPWLVLGVLATIVGPLSLLERGSADDTLRLLIGTLAVPVLLAIPVGIGFAKPTFWSEDLAVPAFIAVRPLTDEDLVAIKVKVAVASVAVSWALLLVFAGAWLTLWANLDSLGSLAIQLWAFHGRSVVAVYGTGALTVVAGMLLTWRFLVSRLWSGLSGRRALFLWSAVSLGIVVVAGLVFDATRLPRWIVGDPVNMRVVVWAAAVAVIAKYWLAAYAWRQVDPRYLRHYLLAWVAGTVAFGAAGLVLWNIVRIYVALDAYRFQSLMMLLALLAVPLARVGLAVSVLARNRHRS